MSALHSRPSGSPIGGGAGSSVSFHREVSLRVLPEVPPPRLGPERPEIKVVLGLENTSKLFEIAVSSCVDRAKQARPSIFSKSTYSIIEAPRLDVQGVPVLSDRNADFMAVLVLVLVVNIAAVESWIRSAGRF